MIARRMLIRALAPSAVVDAAALVLAMVDGQLDAPPAGAVQPNETTSSQVAASSLDNAREGDGTLYGYRV